MKWTSLLVALALGLLLASACASPQRPARAAPAADGWRPLFDRQSLAGWSPIGTAVWRVEQGMEGGVIVGGQDGDPSRAGLLRTTALYGDFELELEFMIDEHGKYNSGIYLRNAPEARERTGYQVNIGRAEVHEYTGGIYTTRWLATGDETDKVRRPNDWNRLQIRAQGAHLQVALNGVPVVDFTDPAPDPKFLGRGVIALQTYGAEGHAGWVKFRALRIREL